MALPAEVQDREDYKARMLELLEIDPARTVLLTVDMQRDYLDLDIATAPVARDETDRVMKNTMTLLDACRGSGIPVVHCYVRRRVQEAERGYYSTTFGRAGRAARLSQNPNAPARSGADRVAGSGNDEVMPELLAPGDVHMDAKRQMDSFHGTDLETLLGAFEPATLLITGINTDTCVYATTFGASFRGYAPVVVSDCTGSYRGTDHHWMALELMSRSIAWVVGLDDVLERIGAGDPTA